MHSTPGPSGRTGALGSALTIRSAIVTPFANVPRTVKPMKAPAGAVAVKRATSAGVGVSIENETRMVSGTVPRRLIVSGITAQAVTRAGGAADAAAKKKAPHARANAYRQPSAPAIFTASIPRRYPTFH